MSYVRGNYYLWRDGKNKVHLWALDGYDGWDEAAWADGVKSKDLSNASGVGIPKRIIDEFVVMRFAEMLKENLVVTTINRATKRHKGNFGCKALIDNAEGLKMILQRVKLKRAGEEK